MPIRCPLRRNLFSLNLKQIVIFENLLKNSVHLGKEDKSTFRILFWDMCVPLLLQLQCNDKKKKNEEMIDIKNWKIEKQLESSNENVYLFAVIYDSY